MGTTLKQVFGAFVIALLFFMSSCTVYRTVKYLTPDIDEYNAFPQSTIKSGDDVFEFYSPKDAVDMGNIKLTMKNKKQISVDEYLKKSKTTALLIIRNDTVLFEKYYQGYDRNVISTFFSVTKSITSLLVGIAIDEGYIKNLHDPVTDYIPELKSCDPHFQRLTIEHLLNMQAGLKFKESYTNPFSDMARLFYGQNQLRFIEKLKFNAEPGENFSYNSATTAILGIALERAVGRSYAEYLEEKIWIPLGMEYDASISLDNKKQRSAKSYQGLNATAIDLAKIGRLYLNGGIWNGTQIVSKTWIDKSITPCPEEDHVGRKYYGYQYQWYNDKYGYGYNVESTGTYRFNDSISAIRFAEESEFKYWNIRKYEHNDKSGSHWAVFSYLPHFYAEGILGQILSVDPATKIIVVRLGKSFSKEYNPIHLANRLMRNSPVVEDKWKY